MKVIVSFVSEFKSIQDVFIAYGKAHAFTATHFLNLSDQARQTLDVRDGEFLIELSFDDEERVFKIYIEDGFLPVKWTTDASTLLIDRESVEVIGSIIDEHFF